MKKFRFLIVLILVAATLMSLFACGKKDGGDTTGGETTVGDTSAEENVDLPEWPAAAPIEPMSWPEPAGEVEYTKVKVTSDMITSSTPWNNGADIAAKAFDGNTGTFFDGVESGWVTVDLGERMLIGQLGFAPRGGYEDRLTGEFYGSVDGVKWTLIYDIGAYPTAMTRVNYEKFKAVCAFRYVKYQTDASTCANISEMEIYSAVNIDPALITEPERELYADGTSEDFDIIPENEGMRKLDVTCSDSAVVDNNPSTLAESTSEVKIDLGGVNFVSAVAFISDSSSVGAKIYGEKEDGSRDLMWEVTEDDVPVARKSETIMLGTLKTTSMYKSVIFTSEKKCNLAEIRVYSMNGITSIALTTLPFAMDKKGDVDCIALNWGTSLDVDSYELYRAGSDGKEELVYSGKGTSWQDYGLALGEYAYTLHLKYGGTSILSKTVKAETTTMPQGTNTINNQTGTFLMTKSAIYDGEFYYRYSVEVVGHVANVYEETSKDGLNYSGKHVIVDSSAHPDMKSCKLESVKTEYIKDKNTVIIAAHWEKPDGYSDGKLFLVTGTPGGGMQLRCIERPLGVEVRDMSVFIDDDNTAYLLAAANNPAIGEGTNATIYVFKFKDDYTGIEKVTSRLFQYQGREMPNMIHKDGLYYLFTSNTSGWAPSEARYAVSETIEEEGWSELRPIGSNSTFGSQSSWILKLGSGDDEKCIMHAYRWGPAQGTPSSDTMLAPITFADGMAFFDYYPEILYNADTGVMVPITYGKLLSRDAEVTASLNSRPDCDASNTIDGDYSTAYISSATSWPFTLTFDLKNEYDLKNIQISWANVRGSEAFYRFKIYGSNDGQTWDVIVDNSQLTNAPVTKSVGFNSHVLNNASYRYVKIEGIEPIRWRDNQWDKNTPNAYGESFAGWDAYNPTVYEVRIYGNEK